MHTATEQRNRDVLVALLDGGTFKSPEEEYGFRSEDFEARIPQTGETFDRDSLMAMQKTYGTPPDVEIRRIAGSGDLWFVETVNTYENDSDYYACVIVEFENGKIRRETRYYAPPLEVDRPLDA